MQTRADKILEVDKLGSTKTWYDNQIDAKHLDWNRNNTECFKSNLETWYDKYNLTLNALLKLPEEEYETKKETLLKQVEEGMEAYKLWNIQRNGSRRKSVE